MRWDNLERTPMTAKDSRLWFRTSDNVHSHGRGCRRDKHDVYLSESAQAVSAQAAGQSDRQCRKDGSFAPCLSSGTYSIDCSPSLSFVQGCFTFFTLDFLSRLSLFRVKVPGCTAHVDVIARQTLALCIGQDCLQGSNVLCCSIGVKSYKGERGAVAVK